MASLIGQLLGGPRNAARESRPPVPVGGGALTGVPGMSSAPSRDAACLRAYKSQGTVYANVALLAHSTAGPQWQLFRKDVDGRVRYTTSDQGSDQRVQVIRHAALSLLKRPNPFWTRFRLFEMSQMWMDLTGRAFWVVDKRGSTPIGLWPVRPDRMVPVPHPTKYLAGWLYRSPDGRETIPLRVDEVIYNCTPDPEDPYGGASPAMSVITEIDGARYASEWNRNFFVNSARPDGVITVPGELSDEQFDAMTDRWREAHRGVARAHRVAVLEGGATWTATSTNPKDMDFANLMSTGGDRIREAWGMHKVMTGVTEDVNRANAQTGEEIFAIWQVTPRLNRWRDVLNHQFLPMFGDTGKDVEFDFVYPMPKNREQDALELTTKSTAAQVLVSSGYDPADVLVTVGLPAMGLAERAVQAPALPPGWVAEMAPGAPAPAPAAALGAAVAAKKDAAAKVFEQLAQDYPPAAMAWAHSATWTGPVMVPLSHIEPDMQWLDRADPHHVADFVARREAGKKLKPVILVKTPSDPMLKLVDGHHRYLAEKQLGEPVRAWIATVSSDHGGWETMHDYQLHPSASARAPWPGRREMAAYNMAGVR